jgi:hypothetical protein
MFSERNQRMPRRTFTATLLVAALLGLAACTAAPEPKPTPTSTTGQAPTAVASGDGVLRIGTLFPMTGDAAASGAAQVAGTELAVREIAGQAASGVTVELVHRNSAGNLAAAVAEFQARGVDVVLWDAGSTVPADVTASVAPTSMVLLALADFANGGTPVAPNESFGARLLTADPGLAATPGGAEGYDGVIVSALAARVAADDAGASVAAGWKTVATGPTLCASFGECLAALDDGQQIGYQGATGSWSANFA